MKKEQYISPTIKCVEFKAELGFAMSQGLGNSFGNILDYDFSHDELELEDGSKFTGYFTGDNSDWD